MGMNKNRIGISNWNKRQVCVHYITALEVSAFYDNFLLYFQFIAGMPMGMNKTRFGISDKGTEVFARR